MLSRAGALKLAERLDVCEEALSQRPPQGEDIWLMQSQPLAAPKTLLTTHACDAVLRDYC